MLKKISGSYLQTAKRPSNGPVHAGRGKNKIIVVPERAEPILFDF
jgi:hypothetical protein